MTRFRRQMVATTAALGVAAIAAASASAAPTATTIPLAADSKTEGITRGPDGALWFANFGTHSIGRVTTGLAGTFSLPNDGPMGPAVDMSGPFDITLGPDNNLWFTAFNGTVGKLTAGGGITGYPAVASPTANLKGITAGANGELWYLEAEGDMLRSITTGGGAGSAGAGIALAPLGLAGPDGITAGPAGDPNVYFTTDSGGIGKHSTSGGGVTSTSVGVDANGITVGPDGNLWVTSGTGAGAVSKVSPGGAGAPSVLQSFPTQGATPRGITTGPDGALWFAESGSNSVGRVTTSGAVSSIPVSGCGAPDDIATASDGSLWVTCFGSATLARITESGAAPPPVTPGGGGGAVPIAGLKASFSVKKTVIAGKVFTVKVKFNKAVSKVQVRVQIRSANTKLKGSIKKFKTIKSKLITGTQGSIPVKIAKPGLYKLRLSYKNGPKSVNTNAVKLTVKPRPRR
jgi:virginiamycin B lyase